MAPTILYSACVLGAVGLYLLLRPAPRAVTAAGGLLALGGLAWLMKQVAVGFGPGADTGPEPFFVIFSLIAVVAALRMITHSRPVYCALYFVLVVLSSAGLLLLLGAEFIAFALVIVYAGAILITYLFVLMLAQQAPQPGEESAQPEYDLVPREPAAGAAVGFVILALLSEMIFSGVPQLDPALSGPEAEAAVWAELEQMPGRFEAEINAVEPGFHFPPERDPLTGRLIRVDEQGAHVLGLVAESAEVVRVDLPESAHPENVQRVGWWLVHKFPVSLELAGVILLMAMFGAVVLARREIELSDDEKREAAGLRRLALEAYPEADSERAGGGP